MPKISPPINLKENPKILRSSSSLPQIFLEELKSVVKKIVDGEKCYEYARDWWPITIWFAKENSVLTVPPAVAVVSNLEELKQVVKVCAKHSVAIVPIGGQSGVCGGAICKDKSILLDLTGIDQVLHLDEVSQTVTVMAGIYGPKLEEYLNKNGFTLGHFPQSFEMSTLGGWLACRSAGQFSNRYGKIEDMVVSLEIVDGNGEVFETAPLSPRAAVGPDFNQIFLGSEGTLGVIYSAVLKIHRKPEHFLKRVYAQSSFSEGLDFMRRIIQRGSTPAVMRLYDSVEAKRNFKVDESLLIIYDEADPTIIEANDRIIRNEAIGLSELPTSLVDQWLDERNRVDQLGEVIGKGVMVDTAEISASWSALIHIYDAVKDGFNKIDGALLVSAHSSHSYLCGGCLYFTFALLPDKEGNIVVPYVKTWDLISEITMSFKGAISHHHGIGINRSKYVSYSLGNRFKYLKALKEIFDPHDILNPWAFGFRNVNLLEGM